MDLQAKISQIRLIENIILTNLVICLTSRDYLIKVLDEETTVQNFTKDWKSIFNAIGHTDFTCFHVRKEGIEKPYFIAMYHGNNEDIISDYSHAENSEFDKFMTEFLEWIDTLNV